MIDSIASCRMCHSVIPNYFLSVFSLSHEISNATVLVHRGHVDGVKCDRALLETAERLASNGPMSLGDAMDLWDKAKDGRRLRDHSR